MNTKRAWSAVAAAAAALLALAACGGGGGDDRELSAVPDSAVSSPAEFSAFVGAREASDSREPLTMNSTMPPTSETAEPVDID